MGVETPQSTAFEAIACVTTAERFNTAYAALLAKWPVPCESLQIPTRLGSTHVLVSGPVEAPAVVLLHGMRATALVWLPNVEALSRHFRVYAIDVIGQGGRSMSNRRIRQRRDYAEWMCDLFDALAITQASLVGSSYGGFLALNQASFAPERVNRVVLINPAGVFVSVLPLSFKFLWARLSQQLMQVLRLKPKQRKMDIAQYLGRSVRLRPDEAEWANLVTITAADRKTRRNIILPAVFSTAELRAIRAPTLLLMGDNDLLYDPVATLHKAKQRMPSLQAQMLAGAHHIAAMAKPDETNRQIIRFLGKDSV